MRAMVKTIEVNGDSYSNYSIDNVNNVICTNDYFILVLDDGTSVSYECNDKDYKRTISIM